MSAPRPSFRAVVLTGAIALVAGILAVTLFVVGVVLDRAARRGLEDELRRGGEVFTDLQSYRGSLFRAETRTMADEPRLKAVVDAQDVSHATVLGVARDLRKAIQSDLFLVTDGTGSLLADVADPKATGFDMSKNPVVAAALESGEGHGIWRSDGKVFQVQAQRLTFGATHVGVVVLGWAVDDRVAETVYRQTGDAVAILHDGKVAGASPLDGGEAAPREAMAAALGASGPAGPLEVSLEGHRYVAVVADFPGHTATWPLRYAILRSLDRAREPARRVLLSLGVVVLTGLLAAVVFARRLSRRLAQPVEELVRFAGALAEGKLDRRVAAEGPAEIATLGEAMNRMAGELASSRDALAEKERLARDLELAAKIQTSILPRAPQIPGLQVGACMLPAERVGGDYYDVLPAPGGAWIGIGDVAGHGVSAGLVMLMLQSAVAALVRDGDQRKPSELVAALNAVLHENIRARMLQDEHVTFTLLRYLDDGQLVFAGAHEELVILRAATGRTERIATLGTWLGGMPDIRSATQDQAARLEHGDLLVLYSDGLIQTMNPDGDQFGLDRVCEIVEQHKDAPVQELCDRLVAATQQFGAWKEDDVTVVVIRRA